MHGYATPCVQPPEKKAQKATVHASYCEFILLIPAFPARAAVSRVAGQVNGDIVGCRLDLSVWLNILATVHLSWTLTMTAGDFSRRQWPILCLQFPCHLHPRIVPLSNRICACALSSPLPEDTCPKCQKVKVVSATHLQALYPSFHAPLRKDDACHSYTHTCMHAQSTG
jgi:hypothetical protein